MWRDSSRIALRETEKEKLGVLFTIPVTEESEYQLAISFAEGDDFSSDGNNFL